jgi:hypothetical protein
MPAISEAERESTIFTPTKAAATYRKTSQDVWVVFARHEDLVEAHRLGAIRVTKKNGDTKVEAIAKVGKPFDRDGDTFAYGYINDGWYQADLDGPIRTYAGAAR